MKYYLDTEFHEYSKKPLFGKPINTIELISIGIIAEDGREYYAICNEFDVKAAWNSYQEELPEEMGDPPIRTYWLRKNILNSIGWELFHMEHKGIDTSEITSFSRQEFKRLLFKHGKSRKQIANEVKDFVNVNTDGLCNCSCGDICVKGKTGSAPRCNAKELNIEFYAYYADYDWVVFCWLFGRMIDLPTGFPMSCKDLKQMLDEKVEALSNIELGEVVSSAYLSHPLQEKTTPLSLTYKLNEIKKHHPNYPKQEDEHNALADAKWNKKLHEFINRL